MSEEFIFSNEVFLIYGRAKIGKSTLAAQFPDPLFIATEPGLKYIKNLRKEQKYIANSWQKILEATRLIDEQTKAGTFKYKTIVIDTIDNAVDYCNDYVCAKEGISHPSELGMGKGWNKVTMELKRQLFKLQLNGTCLVMISHDKNVEIKTRTEEYNRTTIALGGKNREAVINMPDHILYVDSEVDIKTKEERRFIRTCGSKYYEAGSRNDVLAKAEGGKIPLDYNELVKYFKQEEN